MTRFSSLAVDSTKAVEGVWIPWLRGVRLRIARLGNRAHREFLTSEFQRIRAELGRVANEKESENIEIRALATHVLKDWDGLVDDNDQPLTYTVELGVEMLQDSGYEEMSTFVLNSSTRMEHYAREQARETEGK